MKDAVYADMLGRRLPVEFDCGEPGGGGVTVITGSGGS